MAHSVRLLSNFLVGPTLVLLALLSGVPARRPSQQANHRLALRVLFFEDCGNVTEYVRLVNKTTINLLPNGDSTLNVFFNVAKTVRSAHAVKLVINKCRDIVSDQTCEYFTTWSWPTGACRVLSEQTGFWSPGLKNIEPDFHCPIHRGMYRSINGTLDLNHPTVRASLSDYIWTAKFQAEDQDGVRAVCIRAAMQALKVPRKRERRHT